jgi:hypothetical protein
MLGRDNRVLLLGPGPDSDLGGVTDYVARTINESGFVATYHSGPGTVAHELDFAMRVPFVISIVCSVGTATEALLLLERLNDSRVKGNRPVLTIVIAEQHRRAQFARAAEERYKVALCDCQSLDELDGELGALVLSKLAAASLSRQYAEQSGTDTERADFQADDPGRRLIADAVLPEPTTSARPRSGKPTLLFVGLYILLFSVSVLTIIFGGIAWYAVIGLDAVITVIIVFPLMVFLLVKGFIPPSDLADVVKEVVRRLSSVIPLPAVNYPGPPIPKIELGAQVDLGAESKDQGSHQ